MTPRLDDSAPAAVDLLALPGLRLTGNRRSGRFHELDAFTEGCATLRRAGAPCPGCRLKDYRRLTVTDMPLRNRPTRLVITYTRRRCALPGGGLIAELPPVIARRARVTRRLAEHAALLCLERPLSEVVRALGVSRRWLSGFRLGVVDLLAARYRPRAGAILGIDEAHIHGRTPLVITDLSQRRPVAVAERNDEATVRNVLHGLDGIAAVQVVVIDMHRPYRRAVADVLPWATVVVDKRHVLELVRRRLMSLREDLAHVLPRSFVPLTVTGLKRERVSAFLSSRWDTMGDRRRMALEVLLDAHPRLADAYRAKESFYKIFDCRTRGEAEAQWEAWIVALPPPVRRLYASVITSVETWRPQIFAYFDVPERPTAAYTEAFNRRLKEISREGRGNTRHNALEIKALHRLGAIRDVSVRAAGRWVISRSALEGTP